MGDFPTDLEPLEDLVRVLPRSSEWVDAAEVVEAALSTRRDGSSPGLGDVRGKWQEPFLFLRFIDGAGETIELSHGDGYTAVEGAGVDYHHHLETDDLVAVIAAAARGEAVWVRHCRFGAQVASYFDVPGRSRLGENLFHAGRLLAALPGGERVERVVFLRPH